MDLGCGSGQDSHYFAGRGLQVTALDLAEDSLARLQTADPRIKCLRRDLTRLEFKPHSFDVIYAHLSLQYFGDAATRRLFLEIAQILRPQGRFFVKYKSTADPLCGEGEMVGPNMFFKKHLRHFFSPEYLAQVMEPFFILKLRRTASLYSGYRSNFVEAVATVD